MPYSCCHKFALLISDIDVHVYRIFVYFVTNVFFLLFQFLQMVSADIDDMEDTPLNRLSDVGSETYSPIHSPSRISPLDDLDTYHTLSPLARWKLQHKMEDSYFLPISKQTDRNLPETSSASETDLSDSHSSAFSYVQRLSHSSQCDDKDTSSSSSSKPFVSLLKLKKLKSAFTITEDKDIPKSAVSLGHMFALKKRIIKREEKLSASEGIGSDGASEKSSGDSPQSLETEYSQAVKTEYELMDGEEPEYKVRRPISKL